MLLTTAVPVFHRQIPMLMMGSEARFGTKAQKLMGTPGPLAMSLAAASILTQAPSPTIGKNLDMSYLLARLLADREVLQT